MVFSEDCTVSPINEAKKDAKDFKIEMAATIVNSKMDDFSKVDIIKNYLADSIPVIGIIQVYESFVECENLNVWEYDEDYDNYLGGNHAITIIGYDDKSGLFEIMNSWGKDWGNKGYIKIPYEDFGNVCRSAMILNVDKNQLVAKIPAQNTLATLNKKKQPKTQRKITSQIKNTIKTNTFLRRLKLLLMFILSVWEDLSLIKQNLHFLG